MDRPRWSKVTSDDVFSHTRPSTKVGLGMRLVNSEVLLQKILQRFFKLLYMVLISECRHQLFAISVHAQFLC